ncbi:hypothetical protein [Pseudoalteromonas rubra]|nr:hypothetical protein [Pseudoalteromonas rubra]
MPFAASEATVEEVVTRPGAKATPDRMIMQLQDANLAQFLKDAKRAPQQ